MQRMKALKTFQGQEGLVLIGKEFNVNTEYRAKELEQVGLAVPLPSMPRKAEVKAKAAVPQEVEASPGPLSQAGGKTGLVKPQRSSAAVRAPRRGRGRPKGDAA